MNPGVLPSSPSSPSSFGIGIGMLGMWSDHKRRSQLLEQPASRAHGGHRKRHRVAAGDRRETDRAEDKTGESRAAKCCATGVLLLVWASCCIFAIDTAGGSEGALFGLIPATLGLANLAYAAVLCRKEREAAEEKTQRSPARRRVICAQRCNQSRSATSAARTFSGSRRELVMVVRMVDADRQRGTTLELGDHRVVELEAQEMHRRGLDLVLALQVLVGDGEHARASRDLHPAAILDAAQASRAARGALSASGNSIRNVTFQLRPSGISGL